MRHHGTARQVTMDPVDYCAGQLAAHYLLAPWVGDRALHMMLDELGE